MNNPTNRHKAIGYAIKVKTYYYAGTFHAVPDHFWCDNGPSREIFKTREAALKQVSELDSGIYYLSHGEYERPDYKVVAVYKR